MTSDIVTADTVTSDMTVVNGAAPGPAVSGPAESGTASYAVRCFGNAHTFVLTPGTDFLAGDFSYNVAADRWDWSEEIYRIHGFRPGEIVPTTQLLLAHKHPEDRANFETLFDKARRDGRGMVSHHRIIDGNGATRTVLLVARGWPGSDAQPSTLNGYFIDMTAIRTHEMRKAGGEAVVRSVEHRAVIEQAKGILMAQRHIDADTAFELLSRTSQETNTKVWAIAEGMVDVLVARGRSRAHGMARPATASEATASQATADG